MLRYVGHDGEVLGGQLKVWLMTFDSEPPVPTSSRSVELALERAQSVVHARAMSFVVENCAPFGGASSRTC
jgi:hypothetical protein